MRIPSREAALAPYHIPNLVGWYCKIGVGYAYTLAKSHAEWGLMHSAMLMVSAVLRILTPNWGLPSPVGLVQSPCITPGLDYVNTARRLLQPSPR